MIKLQGLYTALITPMKSNKQIDYESLKSIIELQLQANIDGIVMLGTTGEAPTIDQYEKFKLIKFTKELINDSTQLIIGAGSNDTEKTINEVKGLAYTKADAILLATPSYNKPNSDGLYKHFKAVADNSYLPIILYNVPSRTGTSIPISVIEKLKEHPNIIGIKEASGDFAYASKLSKFASKDFTLLSGNDDNILALSTLGYSGVISVLSNALPNEMKYFISLIQECNYKTAKILYDFLLPIMNVCFIESNPIPIKYIMSKMGLIKNNLRPPLSPLSKKQRQIINKTINNLFTI